MQVVLLSVNASMGCRIGRTCNVFLFVRVGQFEVLLFREFWQGAIFAGVVHIPYAWVAHVNGEHEALVVADDVGWTEEVVEALVGVRLLYAVLHEGDGCSCFPQAPIGAFV